MISARMPSLREIDTYTYPRILVLVNGHSLVGSSANNSMEKNPNIMATVVPLSSILTRNSPVPYL